MRTASRWTPAGCVRSTQRRARSARPSLANSMVEELIVELLVQHEGRRLDSVQWLREAVTEAKLHETATAQAMRAALVEFLGRLDPAELEARFERAARRGNARSADKAQYWELFATFYRNLIEMPAESPRVQGRVCARTHAQRRDHAAWLSRGLRARRRAARTR